jgi:hypothetical protein
MIGVLIAVIVLGVVLGCFIASFFLRRYKDTDRPGPGWRSTDEVFADPSTKRIMRVWLDADGERHYVAERVREQAP